VVLLVGASLMVRGFRAQIDQGEKAEPATLLELRLALTSQKYREPHQMQAFYSDVLRRIKLIPGVKTACAVSALPYTEHSSGRIFTIEGRPVEPANRPAAMYQVASSEFFEALHVPLRAGRFLSETDGADAPRVVLLNERLVQRWWKQESPIGKRIKIGGQDSKNPWMTIVGVVGDVQHDAFDREPRRMMFVPYQQAPALSMDIGVRTVGDPLLVGPAVTQAIRAIDPEQPITSMMTMAKAIHNQAIGLNYMAVLMGVFGFIALGLSAIGVYGVMAHLVSEQTHEIGIRIALGASGQNVLRMVFGRGMLTALAGILVGLPIAYALARLVASLIYGVTPSDPITFTAIPFALLVTAALAIYIPARRATKIDPIVALREE